MTECKRCLFTDDFAEIGEHQCEYCDIHDSLEEQSKPHEIDKMIQKIDKKGGLKKYNCIMGISGGLDSSTLLYTAVKKWHLRPLVIHFDNGWNNEQAQSNMNNLIERLNVDAIIYKVNAKEYDDLNKAFLMSGTPDCDIPNDIAMTKLMYETAHKYKIKYILNGHCFRTEGSTPKGWTYMDAKYIKSVYKRFTNKELINYPLFTFFDQIFYAMKGIKNVRPFHYMFISQRKRLEDEMKEFISWQDYGGKHCENIYTEFIGSYVLPKYFDIDKSIVYLSAQVRSNQITKRRAKQLLREKSKFDKKKMKNFKEYDDLIKKNFKLQRYDFDRYDFKKYRAFIWILYKLKVVPYTFYKKYCF
jgi:hypothetical protein